MAESKITAAAKEMLKGVKPGPSPEHIRSVFARYGERMTAGDTGGILALFAPDAFIEDPVGGGRHTGHAELRAFYQKGFDQMGGRIEMKLEGAVRIAGNNAAAAYIVRTINHTELFRVETLDVMTFNDEGLITSMLAYWGPSNFQTEKR